MGWLTPKCKKYDDRQNAVILKVPLAWKVGWLDLCAKCASFLVLGTYVSGVKLGKTAIGGHLVWLAKVLPPSDEGQVKFANFSNLFQVFKSK